MYQFMRTTALLGLTLALGTGCAAVQKELNAAQREVQAVAGVTPLSDMTLEKSTMDDPALEAAVGTALKDAGWKEEILGVQLRDRAWAIKHHPTSGAITHRVMRTFVLAQLPGKDYCRIFSLTVKQEHDGSAYQATVLNGVGDSVKVDCAKAAVRP